MTDLAERIVEAAGAVVFDHDGIIPADQDASRRCARAAIAAAVRESGVDLQRMRDDADWIEESSAYLVGSAVEGFASPDPLAALLRALAGIADAR